MKSEKISLYISNARLRKYLEITDNDFKMAYELYLLNIELSESMYSNLCIVEICLRNAIHNQLTKHFKNEDWFNYELNKELIESVSKTILKLSSKKNNVSCDDIIAELHFGFWTKLFERNFAEKLWKPLRLIFKNTPKKHRQRRIIAQNLYRIREIRNRIYHYEPIVTDMSNTIMIKEEIQTFTAWLDDDILNQISKVDRFDEVLGRIKSFEKNNNLNFLHKM